jgi:hypothetical protein
MYELGYADFAARAEWQHPIVLGHATYWAQEYNFHSRGDYFENTVELVASGSNTNCVLAATPIFCNSPNAGPEVDFASSENQVARGRSMLYEDESFFMPVNLQAVDPNGSGQVNTNAVLGSLTLADPRLFANQAPLMAMCLNTTGHTLTSGDVVAIDVNGGGANKQNCIDHATYNTATYGQYPCWIVTAPASALVPSYPNGAPAQIAMAGSLIQGSVDPQGVAIKSGQVLLPEARTGLSSTMTAVDPSAITTFIQLAVSCGITNGTTLSSQPAGTLTSVVARW